MKFLKTIKKIASLGVGACLLGATLTGAFASGQNLNSYPHVFQNDVTIVVGDRAGAQDVIGAMDINTALQQDLAMEQAAVKNDRVQFSEPGDLLELHEPIGEVRETLTDADLAGLASGVVYTDEGRTDYNQFLRFENSSGQVVFEEDENDRVGDFLKFEDGDNAFEYVIEFEDGLESDVDSDGNLVDLEDESFNILGKTYTVAEAGVTGSDARLTLFAGDVLDTLEEGETRTYTVDGKQYEVSLLVVSDNRQSAKFVINGEMSDQLKEGDTDMVNGIEIGIRDIMPNEAQEETGGDIVEFYMGVDKLEFKDDYTDAAYSTGVEVNDENIEDGSVSILGSLNGDVMTINALKYRLDVDGTDGDAYVESGHGLSEYLREPQGMLHDGWDITYESFGNGVFTPITLDSSGDDGYELGFTNSYGTEYNIDLIDNSNDDALGFKYGKSDDYLIFAEGTAVPQDSSFVLTDRASEKGVTYVMRYNNIDDSDNTITVSDVGSGDSKEFTYTGTEGVDATGELIVGGNSFQFVVLDAGTGYSLLVDMNNDGSIDAGDEAMIVVKGGGLLQLDSDLSDGVANLTLTTLAKQFDNAVDNEVIELNVLSVPGNEVDVDVEGVELDSLDRADVNEGMSDYGVRVTVNDERNDPDSVELEYPRAQIGGQAFVTIGHQVTQAELDAKAITVQSARLASEVSSPQNVILVGGPCANSLTAQVLNADRNDCAAGFTPNEAFIKLVDWGDKVALVVAGYEAEETRAAAKVIADGRLNGITGKGAKVTLNGQAVLVEPTP